MTRYASWIKLSHTIFALPFALASAALAAREVSVSLSQVVLIILAMAMARSSAMGFNRLVDRHIDAGNPRTAQRELVTGEISVVGATWFTILTALAFVGFAGMLSTVTLKLSPIALFVVWGYSLTKRFTALCHLFLGLALALAPVAVWIALVGDVAPVALWLALAVGTWVAGFDILYACQDAAFDTKVGLHSMPVALGLKGAMVFSGLLHVVTVGALIAVPMAVSLAWPYWIGVGMIAGTLVYEHWLIRPNDLSKMDKAFFDLNGAVSLIYLGAILLS
jgi:4-hydroxybenzoate polyprenyltransferase